MLFRINRRFILIRKMSSITPPVTVKHMKVLDKTAFDTKIEVPSLRFACSELNAARRHFKKYILKLENFRPVQSIEGSEDKRVFLRPETKKLSDLSTCDQEGLTKLGVPSEFPLVPLDIKYEHFRGDAILKAVLPDQGLSSYSRIGHIVHVNLHENLIEYKQLIGKVLLDKTVGARTIVNKTDIINSTYRNFQMEVLCGDHDLIAKVKENHCSFELDFSSVYWNPRLCTEHEKIVEILKKGDVLYDVFAGIGPFSVPAAKKGVQVFANDLNPESYKWLQHNMKLNKVKAECFNKDGRDFIRNEVRQDLIQKYKDKFTGKVHIAMNLPALATTFLDVFYGLLPEDTPQGSLPQVYVYCFVPDEEPEKDAVDLVHATLPDCQPEGVHLVRKVSPSKNMMRVTLQLDRDLLTSQPCKKQRLDSGEP
ncbi:hypothetical protein B566_EDAN011546 [Ephemera danica]|nr:hypothetical protein B566_EDAN011546 [Ephemera danica]